MTITRESQVLILICLLDLASTLVLLSQGQAREGNPLMQFYLHIGVWAFVCIKLALVILPIFVAEWSMRYRPKFVRAMLRTAIAAYLSLYFVVFLSANVVAKVDSAAHMQPPHAVSAHAAANRIP